MGVPAFAEHALGFEHVGVSVADLDAMSAWYERALGMTVEHRFDAPELAVRALLVADAAGYRIELIELAGSQPNPRSAPSPDDSLKTHGYGHVALRVDDLEATYAALLACGATSVMPPKDSRTPGCRYAYVTDPEGNQLQLMGYDDDAVAA